LWDLEETDNFEDELRALATTDMATQTLSDLLAAEPDKLSWEVGEALAECILEDRSGLQWPWNSERDKRTPKASLPGADLIGFATDGKGPLLAVGEVKTSADSASPPGVMYGRSGIINQIDDLAKRRDLHLQIFKWLRPRCSAEPLRSIFQQAAQRYLGSGGTAIVLFGMLMRDTPPNQDDLRARAKSLAADVQPPKHVILAAWYLPVPIADWVNHCPRAA
jgi:hypothetical protein